MIKSVLKEVCIMLLLCIAIVLILGVIFYDSIPSNKAVPNKLSAYTTPENVQTEIDEEVSGMNKVEVSYEITSSDLTLYKQTQSYTPGKPDPFSASTSTDDNTNNDGGTETNNNTATNTNTGTNQNSGTENTTTNADPNSTGTFFNETGHK